MWTITITGPHIVAGQLITKRHSSAACLMYLLFVLVPSSVWRINIDTPEEGKTVSMDDADNRWWEQVDLTKLILASNALDCLSEDVKFLPALVTLDVGISGFCRLLCHSLFVQ